MTAYDIFAPYYDATMGDRSDVIKLLNTELAEQAVASGELLELACGTGSILEGFGETFKLTGIDQSTNMLQIAQQKLPFARFVTGDMTTFQLNTKFDAVLCVFDSINHLVDLAAWQKLFEATHAHLKPNGIFIFDMNTVGRMKKLLAMPTYTQSIGNLIIDMEIEPTGADAVDWLITVQEQRADGTIQVYEDAARERSYPLTDILNLLAQTGFRVIKTFDSSHKTATDNSDRVYFVCVPSRTLRPS